MTLLLLLADCTLQDNFLDGSLVESYGMRFDETRARLYDSELSLEFVDNLTQPDIVSLRVTVPNTPKLGPNTTLDLVKDGGHIARGEGYESPLPELDSGALRISDYAAREGAKVDGRFRAVFFTPEQSRLVVRGAFDTTLEIVDDL